MRSSNIIGVMYSCVSPLSLSLRRKSMNEMNCHHVLVSLDTKQRGGCLKATEKVNFNIVNKFIHDTINI